MYGDWIYEKVKFILRNMDEIRRETAYARIERKGRKGSPELHGEGYVSNPTAKEAEMNMTPLKSIRLSRGQLVKDPEAWIRCVDEMMRIMSPEDRNVAAVLIRKTPWEDALRQLSMSKGTYYSRRDRVLALIAMKAVQDGLIKL